MNEIQQHLSLILRISINSQNHFINKNQDDHIRFVYCGIQKIQKISRTFFMLYHQLEDDDDLEFSFGILARTLLMDMILMLKLKSLISSHEEVSEELKRVVKKFCYSVIVDGVKHELSNIQNDDRILDVDKKKYYTSIDKAFPNAFDFNSEKPKPNSVAIMNISLSKFCKESKNQNLNEQERICYLYSYYSKYDHLSHHSSFLPSFLSFEERRKKFDSTVVLILMHLQDLLATAHDFNDDYKMLSSYIREIKNHLNSHYS